MGHSFLCLGQSNFGVKRGVCDADVWSVLKSLHQRNQIIKSTMVVKTSKTVILTSPFSKASKSRALALPETPTRIAPAASVPKLFKKFLRSDDAIKDVEDCPHDLLTAGTAGVKASAPFPEITEERMVAVRRMLRGLMVDVVIGLNCVD